jgi:hypothetical protein
MDYVVDEGGEIRLNLDDDSRDAWVVEVDYREVTP